jgi:hypothetical protein
VLTLFRKLNGDHRELPAPWWLRPLERGELPSRAAAFELEDEIHTVLSERDGWVFVPWAGTAETGFWEYGPSDRAPMTMPTTVSMTGEHQGWIHIVAAHAEKAPLPVPARRASGLITALPTVESW